MPKIVHNISVSGYRAIYCGSLGHLVLGTYGSYGIEQIQLTLEPDWAGLVVTANFVTSAGNTPVLVPESGLVDVPPEATAQQSSGSIVLQGTASGVQIYTVDIPFIVLGHADISGQAPAPTPDKWEQFVAQVQGIVDKAVPLGGNDGDVLTKTPDGNAWQPPQGGGGGGTTGQDGGYYTPSIQQPTDSAAQVSWTASDDTMPPVDPVTLKLPQGVPGRDGQDGAPGADGITPTIGANGNWYLGEADTGKPSRGEQGPAYTLTDADKKTIAGMAASGIVDTVQIETPAYTNQVPTSTDTSGAVYNGSGIGHGMLNSSGAVVEISLLYVTGFIPCKKGDVIRVKDLGTEAFNENVQFALYQSRVASSANIGKIVSTIASNSVYGKLTVSGNVVTWETSNIGYYFWDGFAYARFTTSSPDVIVTINQEIVNTTSEQKQLAQDIKVTENSIGFPLYSGVLSGKKVVVFGDSIIGMVRDSTSVTAQIAEYTGADVVNAGFGGCRMSVHPTQGYAAFSMWALADAIVSGDFSTQNAQASLGQDYFPAQVSALEQVDFDTVDMIVIHYGTNDFSAGVQIDNPENPTDTSTLCGALRYSLNKIIPKYPQAKVFISVPLFRVFDGTSSDSYQNSIEKTLPEYVSALSGVAAEYHISCIDGYDQLGVQMLNASAYLSDDTHPSEIGRYRFGRLVGGSLIYQ